MKMTKILLMVAGVVSTGFALFTAYMTSGLKLLAMDSRLGWVMAHAFRPAIAVAILCLTGFALLAATGGKASGNTGKPKE